MCARLFKPIKSRGKTVGAIGVIGPLRMDYAKVLATLDNLGGNVMQLLGEPILQYEGEIDCRDLFHNEDEKEKILLFTIG